MRLPKFEDVHQHDGGTAFYVTNEAQELFRDILGGQRFQRTAGIASGGEMPLFVLLPQSDEVVAVDHTYTSVAMAYAKALLLAKLGAEGCKALLLDKHYSDFVTQLNDVKNMMPEVLKKHLHISPSLNYYNYANEDAWNNIRREWAITPLALMKRARRRLDRLTFIHGDLTDLVPRGPFDVLYVSNAFGKTSRTGRCASAKDIAPALKEGGTLLTTDTTSLHNTSEWKSIRNIRNTRQTGSIWTYSAYQRLKVAQATAVTEAVAQAVI